MKTPKLPPQTRLHSCHDGRSPQGGKSDDDLLGQCEASSAVKYHDEGPYLSKGSLCGKIWAAGRSIIMILMAVLMTGFAVNAFKLSSTLQFDGLNTITSTVKTYDGIQRTYMFGIGSRGPPWCRFSLSQVVEHQGNPFVRPVAIEGEIHIRQARERMDMSVRVDVQAQASDSQLIRDEFFEHTVDSLIIRTPSHLSSSLFPSVRIQATIWISPGVTLENLEIDSHSLPITVYSKQDYSVLGRTKLSTVSRPIVVEAPEPSKPLGTFRSREIVIHTISGSITGTYPLYELLSITTISGTISIFIVPKSNPQGADTKPASLVLSSTSSSIYATTLIPTNHTSIPNRKYQSHLSSTSGSLDAILLHTLHSILFTTSGDIRAEIHPFESLPDFSGCHISTRTVSGYTSVSVHPSLSHPSLPIRHLSATHHHVSGSLDLAYPAHWEGRIHGKTTSGSLDIDWAGVKIIRDRKGVVGREIEAIRGDAREALLEFHGASGRACLRGEGKAGDWEEGAAEDDWVTVTGAKGLEGV